MLYLAIYMLKATILVVFISVTAEKNATIDNVCGKTG